MFSKVKTKIAKLLAITLMFSVGQVYVQANLAVKNIAGDASNVNLQANEPIGKLATRGNKPITVNQTEAPSGTTIMSGATLITPADTSATVQLPTLGTLDIAPSAELSLTFNASTVTVNVAKGCVVLTTNKAINGSVITPQGTTERTDPSKYSSVDICTGEAGAAAPIVNQGAAVAAGAGAAGTAAGIGTVAASAAGGGGSFGIFGLGTGATIALFSAAAVAIVAPIAANRGRRRGRNPSPGTPRGPIGPR